MNISTCVCKCECDTSIPRRNNKCEQCDKKQDQQIRSIFLRIPRFLQEETRSELVLGKRDWKYGQTCFVTTTVNRRNTFCCVNWVPLLISSYLRKAKKIINEICSQLSWRNTLGKFSVPLLVPNAFSRTWTVVKERFFFDIACDRLQSHAWDRMRSHEIALSRVVLLEETRSELFWGETGLKIRPDVFRHDNCERISYLF